jgi:hypothetical protein
MRQWLKPVSNDTEIADDRSIQEQEKLSYPFVTMAQVSNLHQGYGNSASKLP